MKMLPPMLTISRLPAWSSPKPTICVSAPALGVNATLRLVYWLLGAVAPCTSPAIGIDHTLLLTKSAKM